MSNIKIELFNNEFDSGKEYEEKASYYETIEKQWEVAVNMANEVSNRRSNMNNFYITVLAVFIPILISIFEMNDGGKFVSIAICVVGIIMCFAWINSIKNYALLNEAKFRIINSIEAKLPVNVMKYEWEGILQNNAKYKMFSKAEKQIPWMFLFFFGAVLIISIVMLFI